jgi:hypothetical protein
VRVSYQPPPDPYQSAAPQPQAPAGQYSPDGRWFWNGQQWIAVQVPGPAWARPYAPPEGRSAAAVALVALAGAGVALFFIGESLDLIAALAAPGSAVEAAALVVLVLGLIVFLAGFVGAAIAVPMWMHRAFRNLPALGEQGLRWSPAWAAGGWFIPFANFVIPYLVMRELWSSSGDGQPLPQRYWAAWIAAYVLQLLSNQFMRFNRPLSDVFGILNDVALIVAAFLLITIIRRATRRQRDRQAQLHGR